MTSSRTWTRRYARRRRRKRVHTPKTVRACAHMSDRGRTRHDATGSGGMLVSPRRSGRLRLRLHTRAFRLIGCPVIRFSKQAMSAHRASAHCRADSPRADSPRRGLTACLDTAASAHSGVYTLGRRPAGIRLSKKNIPLHLSRDDRVLRRVEKWESFHFFTDAFRRMLSLFEQIERIPIFPP